MERMPADHRLLNGHKAGEVVSMEEPEVSSLVNNGTVDYLGRPADKKNTGGWSTAPLIFGGEMCERMSAFGIGYNLVTYLVGNLHLSKPYSANMVTNFIGTAFLTCIIGGFVADTWLGRYMTIAVFGTIQFLGLILITLFASLPVFWQPHCDPPEVPCQAAHGMNLATLYIALYLIALGTGGIKSCVSAFGADQFDHNDPLERKHMAYFFNWFFFFISMGALVAVTLLVYIQDKLGRGWGFGVTSSCMLFAVVVLVGGRRVYRYSIPQGSPFTSIARVVAVAFKKRKLELPLDPATMLYEVYPCENGQLLQEPPGHFVDRIMHTDQFLFLSKAAIVTNMDSTCLQTSKVTTLASQYIVQKGEFNSKLPRNYPKTTTSMVTVTQVEEVKILIRLLPILFTTFLFWTVYAQMTTFTVEQAVVMDRKLSKNFEIPPASIAVFLQLSILTMVVVYDQVFVRVMRHYTGKMQGITTLQRIGVGLVLSFLAMIAAALIEEKRRRTIRHLGSNAHISVFWLLPQYFFVGTGEAFTYIGQLEFFYGESPSSMRSIGTALCLCTMSVGFYSSSFLVDTVDRFSKRDGDNGWLADDLDAGHLDRFYWLLAFLSFLNFFIYLVVARWYTYGPKQNDHNIPGIPISGERFSAESRIPSSIREL
ncbi:unnamed protein product [Calypogeia fissa]